MLNDRGILLLGCGKMGSALLKGWLDGGISAASVRVLEPNPSAWLQSLSVHLNTEPAENPPAVCVLAVKPQIMPDAIPAVQSLGGGGTIVLSIAAGIRIGFLERAFGDGTPIVRTMPNTPAAIGHGISALIGNRASSADDVALAERLLSVAGDTVLLESESQMDAVTAVSGSGPAYVFHLIEALAEAGTKEGLSPELAMRLALSTVAGAGRLAQLSDSAPAQLRVDVTSPGGTTAAALEALMDENTGLASLMGRAVRAAADRSRELGA